LQVEWRCKGRRRRGRRKEGRRIRRRGGMTREEADGGSQVCGDWRFGVFKRAPILPNQLWSCCSTTEQLHAWS
jgi:hypothetical protein